MPKYTSPSSTKSKQSTYRKNTKVERPKKKKQVEISSIFKNESIFLEEWLDYLKHGWQDDYNRVMEWKSGDDWERDKQEIINTYRLVTYIFDQLLFNPNDINRATLGYGYNPPHLTSFKGKEIEIDWYKYDALLMIRDDWNEYKRRFPEIFTKDKVLLFRSIKKDNVEEIDYSKLKRSWSWYRGSAEPHSGYGKGDNEYIVVGLVDKEAIDWKDNILLNTTPSMGELSSEPEREIFLGENIPIIILDVLKRIDKRGSTEVVDVNLDVEEREKLIKKLGSLPFQGRAN
jgi:hypothetical protein